MPNSYEKMDIEQMVEQLEKEARECIEKMTRESETSEKKCARMLEALEFLINEDED